MHQHSTPLSRTNSSSPFVTLLSLCLTFSSHFVTLTLCLHKSSPRTWSPLPSRRTTASVRTACLASPAPGAHTLLSRSQTPPPLLTNAPPVLTKSATLSCGSGVPYAASFASLSLGFEVCSLHWRFGVESEFVTSCIKRMSHVIIVQSDILKS